MITCQECCFFDKGWCVEWEGETIETGYCWRGKRKLGEGFDEYAILGQLLEFTHKNEVSCDLCKAMAEIFAISDSRPNHIQSLDELGESVIWRIVEESSSESEEEE